MKKRLYNFLEITTILANIAVFAAIIFAIIQIVQSNKYERRRIAIEAVNEVRTNDFLKAYARLKTAYKAKNSEINPIIIDDINYVMNIYDNIAVLCIYDIVDRCIIKNSVYPAIVEFSYMLTFFSYPEEFKKNFNTLKTILLSEHCN